MMMLEPFDEWDIAKCDNGYHRYFNEWAERDMVNMVRHYRNNPSVVMWSVGNEAPTQCSAEGYKVATFLRDICHREDPTRPVTCGMDQVSCVLDNGFAAIFDVPGFNYRAHRYVEAYNRLPQNIVLGSETSSTVSSRGVYHFPVEPKADAITPDHQSSSYDLDYCSWSNIPDVDFALADDYPWTIGQFVWTGFDYLGASLHLTTPMLGPTIRPCLVSSTSPLSLKTATSFTNHNGCPRGMICSISCPTGHGRA